MNIANRYTYKKKDVAKVKNFLKSEGAVQAPNFEIFFKKFLMG